MLRGAVNWSVRPADTDRVRPRSLIFFALGSATFPALYLYIVFRFEPRTPEWGLDVAPRPVDLLLFAAFWLGAIVAVMFVARAIVGVSRGERWSTPILGVAVLPLLPVTMALFIGWQVERPHKQATKRAEAVAENFIADLETGRFDIACALAASSFPAHAGGFSDCPSALAALARTYPGDLSVDRVLMSNLYPGERPGRVVVARDGRPAFELTVLYAAKTDRVTVTGTQTASPSG